MLQIVIVNDRSGTPDVGNYKYRVYVNAEQISEGEINGHIRARGWEALLADMVVALENKRTK